MPQTVNIDSSPEVTAEPESAREEIVTGKLGPRGVPRILSKLESAVPMVAAAWAYGILSGDWLLFAILFLVPDLTMLGYLSGPRTGSILYNIGHTYLTPIAVILVVVWFEGSLVSFSILDVLTEPIPLSAELPLEIALIWIAHIAFDRMLGFGLKYREGFKYTHLGRIGG